MCFQPCIIFTGDPLDEYVIEMSVIISVTVSYDPLQKIIKQLSLSVSSV